MKMKKRDIIMLIVSVIILLIALALLYRYIFPPTADSGVKVEIPHPVVSTFDQQQLETLKKDTRDFTQDITPKDSGSKPVIQ